MTRVIELTDIDGIELTSGNSSGLNPGLYKFTLTGVDTEYAYLGIDGKLSLRIESVNVYMTSAGNPTLSGEIQYYNEGTITNDASWIKKTSHDFSFNAADSKRYNVLATDEVIDGTPIRIKLSNAVATACVIYIKALKK